LQTGEFGRGGLGWSVDGSVLVHSISLGISLVVNFISHCLQIVLEHVVNVGWCETNPMINMVKFVSRCSCILTVDDVVGVRGSNILVYQVMEYLCSKKRWTQ
jgi:hypothetical protein